MRRSIYSDKRTMGNCCQPRRDEVAVYEACRVRFPRIERPHELITLTRYVVAKEQQFRGHVPTVQRAAEAASVVDLLVGELASDEVREVYSALGGKTFVTHTIAAICHAASKGKKVSAGV